MRASRFGVVIAFVIAAGVAACAAPQPVAPPGAAERPASYAIYAEYAKDSNKLMKNGLNRRVFNKVEAQAGQDITLGSDGAISLEPGTYRITGFSTVTMQDTFAPPQPKNNNNYPGYCLVYPTAIENSGMEILKQAVAIGSPATAQYLSPSLFDAIYTVTTKTDIAVGHQSGEDLHGEVYLSIYDVEGAKSDYHAVARIAITKI
jgi:hypothetical protein